MENAHGGRYHSIVYTRDVVGYGKPFAHNLD